MNPKSELLRQHSRHQFNNSLQSIIANVEILKFHLTRNDIDSARHATDKLNLAVREVLETYEHQKKKNAA